ncbi:hypothetical protein [Sorangium sp. So ce204]|uniref:hypothetical protein n=1 Tax=Sorangium sp. So ce204 TaxID=3133288 RepID=UPI003F60E92F
MEAQPNSKTIATVVAKMRPADRLPLLLPAHDRFERVLGDLLLMGSTDPDADVEQLLRELDVPGIQACARTYVYEEEFGRFVATVAYFGPVPIDPDLAGRLWPVSGRAQAEAVAEMMRHIQEALVPLALMPSGEGLRRLLIDTGAGWPVAEGYEPPPRGRGRPSDRVQKSLLVLGVKEGIFRDGARPYVDVAPAIASVYEGKTNQESIVRRMKGVRQEMPIPKEWQDTLLCERVSPLRSGMFSAPADDPGADPPIVAEWKAGRWPQRQR